MQLLKIINRTDTVKLIQFDVAINIVILFSVIVNTL